jgi:hypothetical protein
MIGVTIKHYRTIIAHPKTNIGPEKIYDKNSKKRVPSLERKIENCVEVFINGQKNAKSLSTCVHY